MANIYIWFPNETERREFITNMLELKPTNQREKCGGSHKDIVQTTEIANILDQMEQGQTRSPYFALNLEFYGGCLPDVNLADLPIWHKVKVFQRGFRRVYTQKSYWYRPGHWLVVQLRKNKAGRERRAWILDRIPKERIGVNVPMSAEGIDRMTLVWAERALDRGYVFPCKPLTLKDMNRYFKQLLDIKRTSPWLFKGKFIYAWEHLALLYKGVGFLERAIKCLEIQAEFDPDNSDIYLNIGFFYDQDRRMWPLAHKAYMKGLELNPCNEYILYNLATYYLEQGKRKTALSLIDRALKSNSKCPHNLKLKADVYFAGGNYTEALKSYQEALVIAQKGENAFSHVADIHKSMAHVHGLLGQNEDALNCLSIAASMDKEDFASRTKLASIYESEASWQNLIRIAKELITLRPDNPRGYFFLSKAFFNLGDSGRGKWYRRLAEKRGGGLNRPASKKKGGAE